MPAKIKNSGKTLPFEVSFLSGSGRWEVVPFDGKLVWVEAKHRYESHSPRAWAISYALWAMWTQNRTGPGYLWQEAVADLRSYIRRVGRITRADFDRAKAILRECGMDYVEVEGDRFVYFCERGPAPRCGFTLQAVDAANYEHRVHTELKVREGRLAAGTVMAAGEVFSIPVRRSTMTTKTLA